MGAGKGDKYRKVNRNKYDANYISIVWKSSSSSSSSNSKKEIVNESDSIKSRKSSSISQ